MRILALLATVAACSEGMGRTAPSPEPQGVEPPDLEQVGGGEEPDDSAFFSLDLVHTIDIELSTEAWNTLASDPFAFVPGAVTIDGDARFDPVGVRLAGKLGSYRGLDGKAGFKIDLDEYVDGQTWLGLHRLVPKNLVQDPSWLHERIAFAIYETLGVAAPRVGFSWVRVNGQDFGLYENIEAIDQRFVELRWDDPSGNLYDGDYVLDEYWSSYTLLDFNRETAGLLTLDSGEDVGYADVWEVVGAIESSAGTGAWMDEVGAVVDLEYHARFMAAEFYVGQYDGYSNYTNNWRVYFDPDEGRAQLVPWDHDWAFYAYTPMTPQYGLLSTYCFQDERCYALFTDAVAELCQELDVPALLDEIERGADLLLPYIEADPRKEVTVDDARGYQEALRQWLLKRGTTIESSYGVPCSGPG